MEEAIRGLIEGYQFCPVQFTYDVENFVPREVKYSFIAIVKEGLNNIAKHSGAAVSYTHLIREKGEPGVNGGPRGDLLVEVMVSRHPIFQRQDMHIFSTCLLYTSKLIR